MRVIDTYFSNKDRPAPFYYGWMIVFASLICHLFIFGVPTIMLPQIYGPMTQQFDWSRSDVTILASAKFISGAIAAFFIGEFIQKFGVRLTAFLTSFVVGISLMSFIFISEIWHLAVVGVFLGIGSLSLVITIKVLVSRWFQGSLGLALGLALMGTSIAGSTLTFVLEPLLDAYGWRVAVAILSAGIWFIALPIFMIIAREYPDDMGLKTEGVSDKAKSAIKDLPAHFFDFVGF